MQELCHRCGGDLPAGSGESPFCPQCGSPQLNLSLENQSPRINGELVGTATGTGALPPPHPQQVEWKTAIRCALLVASVGALLSLIAIRVDAMVSVSLLWMMIASRITLGFYRKRRPAAWIDAGVGARIGLLVGLCLALEVGVAGAGAGLVARFGLHTMGNFDAQMAEQVQKAIQQSSTPIPPEMLGLIRSSEFRAGMMLMGIAVLTTALLAVSTLGGAFSGLLGSRRRTTV
jgi:hypothetical protein